MPSPPNPRRAVYHFLGHLCDAINEYAGALAAANPVPFWARQVMRSLWFWPECPIKNGMINGAAEEMRGASLAPDAALLTSDLRAILARIEEVRTLPDVEHVFKTNWGGREDSPHVDAILMGGQITPLFPPSHFAAELRATAERLQVLDRLIRKLAKQRRIVQAKRKAEEELEEKEKKRKAKAEAEAQDRRIFDAWHSGAYKTYANLGAAFGIKAHEARQAVDRERKRRNERPVKGT